MGIQKMKLSRICSGSYPFFEHRMKSGSRHVAMYRSSCPLHGRAHACTEHLQYLTPRFRVPA
eukprot:jgi/Botrbrau1/17150/Bobra.0157s0044.1